MTREEFAGMMDKRLKLVRTEYGMTQDKTAYALGISKKTLVEIEKGRRSLGWTGAAACAVIFGDSEILQNDFGGEVSDLIQSIAFEGIDRNFPQTMGGHIWWKDIESRNGFRIQHNIISLHYRLLDADDRRICSSFDLNIIRNILNKEAGGEAAE